MKKYFVRLLEKFGSFEYTIKVLEKLRDEAVEEMNKIGGNSHLEEIFELILNNIDSEVYFDC
jgi:geranylgeranyl pyrophosphate synthase